MPSDSYSTLCRIQIGSENVKVRFIGYIGILGCIHNDTNISSKTV